jgi:hypothetical protein
VAVVPYSGFTLPARRVAKQIAKEEVSV